MAMPSLNVDRRFRTERFFQIDTNLPEAQKAPSLSFTHYRAQFRDGLWAFDLDL
jgi:hypothetical protein